MSDITNDAAGEGHNQPTADVLAADQYLDQVRGDSALADNMRRVDEALRGIGGFLAAKTITSINPNLDALVAWEPTAKNAMERAIIEAHNSCGLTETPAYEREFKLAMSVAVHACTTVKANEARIGNGTAAKPEYRYVYSQGYKGDGANGEPWKKDDKAAKTELANRKAAAKGDAVAIWELADTAARNGGDVDALRNLGAKLASLGVNSGRWRNLLFLQVAQPYLEDYAAEPHIKKVGTIWLPVLAAAREAHHEYVKATKLEERNADELNAAMIAAVNKKLDMYRSAQARNVDKDEEALVDSFYAMVARVEKHFDLDAKEIWTALRGLKVMDAIPSSTKEREEKAKFEASEAERKQREEATANLAAAQEREREATKLARQQEREEKAKAGATAKANGDVAPATSEPNLQKLLKKNKLDKSGPTPIA